MFQLSNKISPLIFIEEDDNTITISSIGGHFIKFNSKTFTIEQIIQFPFGCPLAPKYNDWYISLPINYIINIWTLVPKLFINKKKLLYIY